jgi:hypothetical protein
MNISKHLIDKKNPCKRLNFLMWNGHSRIKIYKNQVIFLKIMYLYIFSMHFNNKFFIWWCFILFLFLFWHYFDIFLFFSFFIFSMWQMLCCYHFKSPLWVHNLFRIHPKKLWWNPLKFTTTWIIKKLTMLIVFKFYVCM